MGGAETVTHYLAAILGALHIGIAFGVLHTDVWDLILRGRLRGLLPPLKLREDSSQSNFVYIRRLLEKIADFHSAPLTISKGWLMVVREKEKAIS
jgi:hypothetical protein